jgi:hypothetical protein
VRKGRREVEGECLNSETVARMGFCVLSELMVRVLGFRGGEGVKGVRTSSSRSGQRRKTEEGRRSGGRR